MRRLLVAASCLRVGLGLAGGERRLERVLLSVKEPPRVNHAEVVQAGVPWVLALRVMDPGRLVVKAGGQVVAECSLGWGEDNKLRVGPLAANTPIPLPRVVNREAGREEVEVQVPPEVGDGELLVLTYDWDWKHQGKPAMVHTWPLRPPVDDGSDDAIAWEFERDFPLAEESPPEPEAEPAATPEDEADEAAFFLGPEAPAFPIEVDPVRPELLWVPAHATWGEIAARLFEVPPEVGAFDLEPSSVPLAAAGDMPRVAVRVRGPERLRNEVLDVMRRALETHWKADLAWAHAKLQGKSIDREEERVLAELSLRWSQRSDVLDFRGESYFDRYLSQVAAMAPDWGFLGEESEKLRKAVALRSKRWKTSYTVTDASPRLAPGDVIGRCYFTSGSGAVSTRASVQVHVLTPLHAEWSMERAEVRTRNLSWNGMRAVIPGADGRFHGYSVNITNLGEVDPIEGPDSRCYWYYPGTVFIREGEWRPGIQGGTGEPTLGLLRRSILSDALASATPATPEPLLGLDHDVLGLLTPEQRGRVFDTILSSPSLTAGGPMRDRMVDLLGRVVLSTPGDEFPPLARLLSSSKVLQKLLTGSAPGLAPLGQAFTLKALASSQLSFDSLDSMPTFHLGREGGTTHLLDVLTDEAGAGPAKRAALRFRPVRQKFELRYFSSSERDQPSRPLRPLELVRVELHGPHPETRIVTAMELAMRASVPDTALVWAAVGRISEMHLLYSGVSALARAPLSAGVAAAATEGGGAVAARQAAVRTMVGRTALVTTMAVVDTYRDELSRTQAGRNFLAVHDFAMLALAARDVHKLVASGLLREWGHRAGILLSQLGGRASVGLRESVESARALARTIERMLAEGKAVATPEGLRFPTPGGAEAFKQIFFAVRAEMAAERAIGGIHAAGLEVQQAERVLGALKRLAEESPDLARAYGAVARRAAALPADKAQAYLAAVDSLVVATRPAAKSALAELLRGSGRTFVKEPIRFLKDAEWLVQHQGLDAEALGTLARKAGNGKVDLGWLRSTALTAEDIGFLAKEEKTTWQLFKKAAEEPGNRKAQLDARVQLRGIAGEMVTQRAARKLFPGYTLRRRQVKTRGGSIIDFEVVAKDGSVDYRAVEVKGWTSQTWRRALEAWEASPKATRLTVEQGRLLKQLEHAIKQLQDAAGKPRGEPFLVCSSKLSHKTRETLARFLRDGKVRAQPAYIDEEEIVSTTKRLRSAFRMPREWPTGVGGGAP